MGNEIRTIEDAYQALDSFDPANTKRALRILVDAREVAALPRIMPLVGHPDAAIRFVAKRAVGELRKVIPGSARRPAQGPDPQPEPMEAKVAVGQVEPLSAASMDPRLAKLLGAPARRREPRPRAGGVPLRWFDVEL